MRDEFKVIPVDDSIVIRGAQLKHEAKVRSKEDVPMADSLTASTSVHSRAVCITDSPHFKKIAQIRYKWI